MALMEVELPNGSILEVEEGTSPEQINAAWQKLQKQQGLEEEEFKKQMAGRRRAAERPVSSALQHGAERLLKGVAFMPTMLADMVTAGGPTGGPFGYSPENEDLLTTQLNRMGSRPGSKIEQYLGAAAEGAGASLTSGPAAWERPILNVVQGASSGAGSEVGAELGGNHPLARLAGGFAGGMVPTLPYAFTGHKEDLARIALRDVDEDSLKRAIRTQHQGAGEGLTLTLSQAMDRPSNIDRIDQHLMNSEAGTRTQAAVRAQPVQATTALKKQVLKLPGDVHSQRGAANLAQEASTDAIQQARAVRRAEFEKLYGEGGKVRLPTNVMEGIDSRLEHLQRQYPNQGVSDMILNLRESLRDGRLPTDDLFKLFDDMEVPRTPGVVRGAKTETFAPSEVLKRLKGAVSPTLARAGKALNEIRSRGYDLHHLGNEDYAFSRLGKKVTGAQDENWLDDAEIPQDLQNKANEIVEAMENKIQNWNELTRYAAESIPVPPTANDKLLNQVDELTGVLRSHKAQLAKPNLNAKPLSAEEAVKFKDALKLVQNELEAASPQYKAANAKYRELSTSTVNPLKKSVVGDLAGKGANEVDPANKTKAYAIFDAGTIPGHGKSSDILTLEREWRKAGRGEDFSTIAKSWLAERIAQASKAHGDRVDPNRARALYDSLALDDKQKQGLRDVLVGMARSQGIDNEQEYAEGFMRFMKILGAAARRSNEGANLPGEVIEQTGRNPISWFLKLFSIVPFSEAAGATKRLYSQKAFEVMDKLMTDPEGVKALKLLAKEPIVSKKAQTVINAVLSSMAADQGDIPLPPEKRAELKAFKPGKRAEPMDLPYFPGMTEAR